MINIEPFVDCCHLLDNRERLLAHATENGYLFFRDLLPEEAVLDLRREVLGVVSNHNLLAHGTDPDEGIRREGALLSEGEETPVYRALYNDILRLRGFHALPHHANIVSVLETFFNEPIFVHPRHICHVIFPSSPTLTTPPHQDFYPVRGTKDTWTVWTPLGVCDADLGGLAIARSSHHRGFLDDATVRLGKQLDAATEWCWNPFRCGDVLMFHSLTIHQGCNNVTADRLRLATSARYQPVSQPVDADALEPHMHWIEWEELYAQWQPDDPLRYYWQSLDLDVQPAYHNAADLARERRRERERHGESE